MASNDIFFFGENNEYGIFSNFYPCEIVYEDMTFYSSEQLFMYFKCLMFDKKNTVLLNNIINERSPKKVKNFGRNVRNYQDDVWEKERFDKMYTAIYLKFTQNEELREILLDTGNAKLYEASPYDKIWGIGLSKRDALKTPKKYYARNLLGKCLMKLREELREESN